MGCKSKTKSSINNKKISSEFIFDIPDELAEGRLQIFLHCPKSNLPIRDVSNYKECKTEPHIEIGAENFINCCYQSNNIIPFLKSNREKYLFLFTTCKSKNLKAYYKKRFVVGYIVKEEFIVFNGHFAVRGTTMIYSFDDSYPLEKLFPNHRNINYIRLMKLTHVETNELLSHFKGKRNYCPRMHRRNKTFR